MLSRIFPAMAGNDFKGLRPSIWLLVPIVAVRAAQAFQCIVNAQDTATRADGVPVASFDPAGQAAVISLFSLSGLPFALLALLGVLVLIRYRALIPLMYVLLLADAFARKAIVAVHPIARIGGAQLSGFSVGSLVNYTLIATMIVGFALSLMRRRET